MRLLQSQPRSAETTRTSRLAPQNFKDVNTAWWCNAIVSSFTAYERRFTWLLQKRAVLSAHRTTDVINRDSNIINGRRFDGHRCDTSLVDTILVVNPSVRHVTCRHVTRRQPICTTCHSSTRHSSSTQCHKRYNSVDATLRSVEPPSVPGRPLFDRLVPISSSRCSPHHDDHRFNDCQWFINPTLDPTSATRHRLHHRRQDSHLQRAAGATSRLNATQTSSTTCIAELTAKDQWISW